MRAPFDAGKFDPHDPAFIADPYPTYRQFREQAPVSRVSVMFPGTSTPLYESLWVFRYADVRTVLEGTNLFLKNKPAKLSTPSDAPRAPFDVLQNMPNGIFSLDPPRHTELRPVLDALFAKAIGGMEETAAAIAAQLLQAARAGRRFDLVSSYAMPLPSNVLKNVLGISDDGWRGIEQWVGMIVGGHDFTSSIGARVLGGTCALALGAYYQALGRGCPVQAAKGRMFDLMLGQAGPKGMQPEEVQQTAVNLTVAGYLSTVFLIATGTLNLLRNPVQLAKLRAEPALIGRAIEEMLRYDAPAQLADRFVAADTELAGIPLKAGTQVTAVLGSANRDPDAFPDPDAFDVTRGGREHVGFGDGIHYCLGAPLVRKIAPVAFRALLEQCPALALEGLPQWQTDPYLRSVSNLPVAL